MIGNLNSKFLPNLVSALCLATTMNVVSLPSAPKAFAQAETLTIGAVLTAAGPVIDDAIAKASNEGDYLIFRTASEMKLVIESLRLAGDDLLSKTFTELDDSQKRVFESLRVAMLNFESGVATQVSEVRESLDQIQQISNDWQFSGPTVLRYSPAIFTPNNAETRYVTVRGISFDDANPRLRVAGHDLKRISLTQNEASFELPSDFLTFDEKKVNITQGEIILKNKRCRFWIFGCQETTTEFEIGLMTLPKILGSITVEITTAKENRTYETRERYRQFGHSSGNQVNKQCKTFNQGPHAPGWFIDTDSVVSRGVERDCKDLGGFAALIFPSCRQTGKYLEPPSFGRGGSGTSASIRSTRPAGFSVEVCARGYVDHFTPKAGERKINIFWREYKNQVKRSSATQETKELEWGGTADWTFSPETESIRVAIQSFDLEDGKPYIAIGNDRTKFFDVEYNSGTKQLLVRAKTPNQIADLN